jgi:undecaprenyl-diphosphatase
MAHAPPRRSHHGHPWLHRSAAITIYLPLLVALLLLYTFSTVADEFGEHAWVQLDRRILLAMREPGSMADPVGPLWFEKIWREVTVLGGSVIVTLMSVLVVGYLLLLREWRTAIVFALAVFGAAVALDLLKDWFQRPRPTIVEPVVLASGLSFPSGHSMLAAVAYPTLGALLARVVPRRRSKVYILLVALVLAFLIGTSRVYLGVHYPSDVIAGWTFGLGWSVLSWWILSRLQRTGVVEAGPPLPPESHYTDDTI